MRKVLLTLLDAAIVIYIFYVSHFLVSSQKKEKKMIAGFEPMSTAKRCFWLEQPTVPTTPMVSF